MTTAINHEEYVRSRWEKSLLNGGLYLYEGARSFQLQLGERRFNYTQKTKAECWEAAYALTLEREEQIRQVEEEIALVRDSYQTCFNIGKAEAFKSETRQKMGTEALVWQRTLNRLHAALAELKKGFRV